MNKYTTVLQINWNRFCNTYQVIEKEMDNQDKLYPLRHYNIVYESDLLEMCKGFITTNYPTYPHYNIVYGAIKE
jgi:hypothetical protein